MIDINKLVNDYKTFGHDELLIRLGKIGNSVVPFLNKMIGEDKAFEFIILIIGAACAADGYTDIFEYKLLLNMFDADPADPFISYDNFQKLVQNCTSAESVDSLDKVIDSFTGDLAVLKELLVHFLLCYLAANGGITPNEISFIKKIAA